MFSKPHLCVHQYNLIYFAKFWVFYFPTVYLSADDSLDKNNSARTFLMKTTVVKSRGNKNKNYLVLSIEYRAAFYISSRITKINIYLQIIKCKKNFDWYKYKRIDFLTATLVYLTVMLNMYCCCRCVLLYPGTPPYMTLYISTELRRTMNASISY